MYTVAQEVGGGCNIFKTKCIQTFLECLGNSTSLNEFY